MSRRDSFRLIEDSLIFAAFDEQNLSIAPAVSPVFRLYYGSRIGATIVTLTKDQLIVKTDTGSGYAYRFDSSGVDSVAIKRMRFIERNYGRDYTAWPKRKHYVDSMIAADPLRNNPSWFLAMVKKANTRNPFWHYALKRQSVTLKQYEDFIRLLNRSHYWQMPPVYSCSTEIADGDYFSLEANTPQKYNFVSGPSCDNDSSDYYKASEMLIRYAGLDKKFSLIWASKQDTAKRKPLIVEDVQLEDVKQEPRKKNKHGAPRESPKILPAQNASPNAK